MHELSQQIAEAVEMIRSQWACAPRAGIILGTGLATFTDEIEREQVIGYGDIPHFPRSTALGHTGQLVCGTVCGTPVVTMEGRFHKYEGYSLSQITLPVRVMHALGIEMLIVSNASGGLNPTFAEGDLMILDDHINFLNANPLVGINDDRLGPRFPDMSRPYDPALIDRALAIAAQEQIVAHRGVYLALTGPNYETRAEYRMLRLLGADAVGMSTVPEVIVAAHSGLPVLAISVVTNVCHGREILPTDGESVLAAARRAEMNLRKIVCGVLSSMQTEASGPVSTKREAPSAA